MEKVWSFNTTIRNPERMENMLRALSELEGVEFNEDGQSLFFGLQIKKRLYKPEKRTLEEQDLINIVHSDNTADDISDDIVLRILEKYKGKSVDAAGRGRTAAGILNRFGLCVALQSKGHVVITDLAKKWLNHGIDDEELFTKFFIKWQYPNEIEDGYRDFNIKPFIGTLSLIDSVNKKWAELGHNPVGLSKDEYRLFVPSLIKVDDIENFASQIIEFRRERGTLRDKEKNQFIKSYVLERASEIFGDKKDLTVAINDLRDYADSSIRYFRMSGLIALRGNDTHVDIAQDKRIEVESLLKNISPQAKEFSSYEEYFDYLSDPSSLELPWQNQDDLNKISEHLSEVLKEEGTPGIEEYIEDIDSLPVNKKVLALEEELNHVRLNKLKNLKHDISALEECILKLESITGRNYETLTARPSLDLEWFVARSLHVLNDAMNILPSFNIGDDGIPTGFKANVSDIECYYNSFNMTVEVTLLLGRDQWVAEGQPVMRHLRDFEDKSDGKETFCIFVAPIIHRDTLNTFWNSNKFSYEGRKQKIIPITLAQYIKILKIAKNKIHTNLLSHTSLNNLLNSIYSEVDNIEVPIDWLNKVPEHIESW